ncbi:MAG TPA: exosortase H [Casimicrobiaceae bacterium]
MLRFLAVFVGLLALMFGFELTPWAQHWLVAPWTDAVARAATTVIHVFDPAVRAHGNVVGAGDGSFAVSIEAGCNGVEATLVLIAAMIAWPASWLRRASGIVIGTLAVQGLNIVRVISLFYLGQWNRDAFEWAHLYVWQALIMLDVLVVWLLWVRWSPEHGDRSPGPPAGPSGSPSAPAPAA